MKAQVTRKKVNLHELFFIDYVLVKHWKLIDIFIDWFKIETEKYKVTFGFKYISLQTLSHFYQKIMRFSVESCLASQGKTF